MDSARKERPKNPKESTNLLSKIFFIWVYKIIFSGTKTKLGEEDVPQPMSDDLSEVLGNRLERRWLEAVTDANAKGSRPSLFKVIVKEYGLQYIGYGCIFFFNDFLGTIIRPILLGKLLSYFSPSSTTTQEGALIYAIALGLTFFLSSLLSEQYFVIAQNWGVKLRVACVSLVYRKCLRLSRNAFGDTSPGQIVNLISNDVARFEMAALLVNSMWIAPIVSAILFYILYINVGFPGLIGFGVLLLILPIQAFNGKLTSVFRLEMAKKTDERVRLMDEIISGIQVIKVYAWEKPFQALTDHARRSELRVYRKTAFLRGLYMIFHLFSTRFSLFCTLLSIVLMGGQLTVEMVFVLSSFLTQLAFILTGLFVRGFAEIAECLVSIKRLENFLLRDEYGSRIDYAASRTPKNPFKSKKSHDKENGQVNGKESYKHQNEDGVVNKAFQNEDDENKSIYSVVLHNVNACWMPNSHELTLENINLKIKPGQLVGVIGTVGSGKSSLLQMLLGELQASQGQVHVNGSISYASQEPWIFAGSVRQNILFGQDYDRRRYNIVAKVCCLERDFELFPRSDMTLVGEKGASLSGGQKARINLARAVYKKADIYLLDDPLSAVDTHVGKHLFQECIEGFLQNKTCILVTHQVQHLSHADHLVLLNNNIIEMQGSFWELQRSGLDYSAILESNESIKEVSEDTNLLMVPQLTRSISHTSTRSRTSSYGMEDLEQDVIDDFESTEREKELTTHIPAKELYLGYIKSGISYFGAVIVVLLFLFTQALASACDYWVSHWISMEHIRQNSPDADIWTSLSFSIVHGIIVIALFVVGLIRGFCFYESALRCSKGMHRMIFKSVVGTHLSFFHNNPSGRILNRFAKDLGAIDELLPKAFMDVGQTFSQIIAALAMTAYVNPWFIIPIIIVLIITSYIRQTFVRISKNLKRIEGVARSPVYSHLNATLQGLTTIRANKSELRLLKEFDEHQDRHSGSLFLFYYVTTAFAYALSLLSGSFISIVTLSFVFFHDDSYGSTVGLTITQVMVISMYLQWGMRMSAEITNQMTSCERLLEYTKLEPEEKNPETKQKLSGTWPTHGQIDMQHVYLRYSPTEPYVIKDLCLTILPKEKVGIVGRTGAGKSSLIGALFRLMEVEGLISIDGIDTNTFTLEELRLGISIIPQDPILFSGTLRRNLDPFDQFPDHILWTTLEEIEMRDITKEMEGFSLDMKVMDGGTNFSVGQRQLICLARAILRNNKILVLDEATANVDPHTDTLIQRTIKRKFADQTVLTIAHRLNTIMDSDKVVVMDAGRLVEFDHPYKLLSNPEGDFFKLVQQTGKTMTAHLIDLARDNYYKTSR